MAEEMKNRADPTLDTPVAETTPAVSAGEEPVLAAPVETEPAVGATTPTAWWRYGLVALGIVAAILLGLQLLGGNPGTDTVPGTPVAEPALEDAG